jgi:PAS domain S-box-containing protein/putative nucleotidyltransferase with HDIG domain
VGRTTHESNLDTRQPDNLRIRAEKFLTAGKGEPGKTSPAVVKKLVLDLKMYQMQLEMQNEELQRAQESIIQARDRYADLYDFAPVGYFTLDREGKIVEVNLAGAQLLGLEPSLLVNQSSFRWVAPESEEIFSAHYRKVFENQGRQTCEVKLRCKRGRFFYAALESVAVPVAAGPVIHCRTTMSDITLRKEAEIELKLKERLLDGASDSIFLHDLEGHFIYLNEAAWRARGYEREELLGKDIGVLMAPENVATRAAILQNLHARGEITFESAHLRKDGSIMPVEIHARYFDLGERRLILSVARDITERQRASAEIARLASFPQLNPNPVMEVDTAGNITFANPVTLEIARKLGFQDGKPLLPADLKEMLQAAVEGGERQFYREVEVKGTVFAAHIHFTPQFQVTRLFLFDITDRKRAEAEVKLNEARLASLLRISQFPLTSTQELFEYALQEAIALTSSQIGYIYSYDDATSQFTLNTWSQAVMAACSVIEPRTIYQLEETGLWGEAVRQAGPIVINDFQAPHPLKKGYPLGHVKIEKFLTVPIFHQGQVVAVAGVANKATDYVAADVKQLTLMMEVVWQIVERQRAEAEVQESLEKLTRALDGTVLAVANTVEMRDPYTAGHQRRVAQLASAIAQEMEFSPARVEGMRVLGCLHDIGKIAIPAEILSRPGRISPMEFSLIKDHPRVGYEIIKDIDFPFPLAEGILQHHERLNGSGYPRGISGPDIIPEARILGVADVVEAMASHRPYRVAVGLDQALEEISQNRGILYDPEVVDTCIKLFKEKEFSFVS